MRRGYDDAAPQGSPGATFGGIAQRLDELDGAFNATFTDQVDEPGDGGGAAQTGSTATGAADGEPLAGVLASGFAGGPSDDPGEARIRLIVASGSDADAAANEVRFVDRIEQGVRVVSNQPWADLLRVERTEVDGAFLVVELRADNAAVLDGALMRRDSLIVSEG